MQILLSPVDVFLKVKVVFVLNSVPRHEDTREMEVCSFTRS